jgi:hypothetical protein
VKEAYEKHKCKGCVWAKWQTPFVPVSSVC